MFGIYQIKNIINNRVYVGSTTKCFGSRFKQHIKQLNKNIHHNYKLQNDYNIYGITKFEFKVLEISDDDRNIFNLEQEYINKIDFDKDYNLCNSNIDCDTYKINNKPNPEKFIEYINNKWLVPIGASKLDKYKIYKEDDKNEIVEMAVGCKLFVLHKSLITFSKVISLLRNSFGYEIDTGRIVDKKKRQTYKIVLSFDEDKKNIQNCNRNHRRITNIKLKQ